MRENFVRIKQNVKINILSGKAYNCANNDRANYSGYENKRGSNYLGSTVLLICCNLFQAVSDCDGNKDCFAFFNFTRGEAAT